MRRIGPILLSVLVATAYTFMAGMISTQLMKVWIAWPINAVICWLLFDKFKLIRLAGFILAPPVALLGFQYFWSAGQAGAIANNVTVSDRSHYVPNTRLTKPDPNRSDPEAFGWQVAEILIGADGFRADPATGRGNPASCQHVLIGDSMIYGSGLAYADTLGPVLSQMGLPACVFGVTANTPADYLATLYYVSDRIAPGAYVAFYIYAYNDFVGINKYVIRRTRDIFGFVPLITEWVARFDRWRRGTIVYAWFHAPRRAPVMKPWQYPIGAGKQIKLVYATDPMDYQKPSRLDHSQREAFQLFLDGVGETAKGRDWRIAMLIHPDNAEVYANLARGAQPWTDLDPRRADGLAMCQAAKFSCHDISRLIYERMIAAGKNPFFTDDRHFSRFGTRIVAENFAGLVRSESSTAK